MSKIIYFGTKGCCGHYPIGIDATLNHDEYKQWYECDCDHWYKVITERPGIGLCQHCDKIYTRYSFPWSIDDDRGGSHTNLFWEGEHTEQEIVDLIKSIPWIAKQFKMS